MCDLSCGWLPVVLLSAAALACTARGMEWVSRGAAGRVGRKTDFVHPSCLCGFVVLFFLEGGGCFLVFFLGGVASNSG